MNPPPPEPDTFTPVLVSVDTVTQLLAEARDRDEVIANLEGIITDLDGRLHESETWANQLETQLTAATANLQRVRHPNRLPCYRRRRPNRRHGHGRGR